MQIKTNQSQKEIKEHGDYSFPILISCESLSRYESGSFLWHWHPEIEITLITEGEMIYNVNQLSFHLREGDVLFGNANTLHSGHMYEGADCQYTSITFDSKLIYGFEHSVIKHKYVDTLIQDISLSAIKFDIQSSKPEVQEIITQVHSLIKLYEEKSAYWELDISNILTTVWKNILRLNKPDINLSRQTRADYARIIELMNYLEQNYQNKITLEDISENLHLCTSECSRLFKRCMNISLFSFLQEYRIEKSLPFLADPDISITEIASLTGFSDPNYYTKVFTRIKGCSPRQYRNLPASGH